MRRRTRSSAIALRVVEALGLMRTYSREGIEPEFVATDRIMCRWAVSVGSGLPTERWDDTERSRPPPLDEDTAVVVDRVYCALPEPQQMLAFLWWKVPDDRLSPAMVANRIGVPKELIFRHVNRLLAAIRAQLLAAGVDC